jgi:hypothetical protein
VIISMGWKTEILVSDVGVGQIFLCSLHHPEQHWDSFSGYRGRCPGDKAVWCGAVHAPLSVTEIENAWNNIFTPSSILKTWGLVYFSMGC